MTKKPKSLKDLKKVNQKENEAPASLKNIHAAIGDAKGNQTKNLIVGISVTFALALFGAIFFIYSQAMTLKIGPEKAIPSGYVTLDTGLGWVSDENQVFVLGSSYRISVHAEGFISEIIDITPEFGKSYLEVTLAPKPASINVTTDPEQEGTKWRLGNKFVSTRASFKAELQPGEHQLTADHPYFEPLTRTLILERAQEVELVLPLSKIQGKVMVKSVPSSAFMTVDGGPPTMLPYDGFLDGGKHIIQIQAAGYVTVSDQIEVTNTQRKILRNYRLRAMLSGVLVLAQPGSARITLDGRAINNGSAASIDANKSYNIVVSQKGYVAERRTVRVSSGQTQELTIRLKRATGPVKFSSLPSGADVLINGQHRGQTPLEIELQALPARVEFRRSGYRTSTATTTPVADQPTAVNVKLLTELEARLRELPRAMTDKAGVQLIRFKPDQKAFYIGAARGEIGQRANEILRQNQLTKHFYAGKYEITFGQYRKYQSGFGGGQANNMPATGVTWAQAAQFSNWLSAQEGLNPFYRISGRQVVGYDLYADGYRLPSEAEWEWLARKAKRLEITPYTWGAKKAVTSASGNLADESAKGSVPTYVPRYNDKYAALAPVGSFPAEVSGLHDMSGNVREWVNDRYSLSVPAKGTVAVNSFGPRSGDGNVVKGSGFRSASLTELRAASRHQEYSASNDIGFRVVRYVYGAEDR